MKPDTVKGFFLCLYLTQIRLILHPKADLELVLQKQHCAYAFFHKEHLASEPNMDKFKVDQLNSARLEFLCDSFASPISLTLHG